MIFEQPHLMAVTSATDNSSAPVQTVSKSLARIPDNLIRRASALLQVRLVVAVHFRVGVLKQQLGNRAGARDALHAIEVSKMLLGRFSLGQQMFRIVCEDGTLIPVSDQSTMRSLSDNLNITGNLNASGSGVLSAAVAAPRPQLAASSIYSSASSGLSSLMPKLRVPEPDLTDPTESLHEVSRLMDGRQHAGGGGHALDGTRDMWRGEFAPGAGRLQLPDVEVEPVLGEAKARKHAKQHVSATALYETWLPRKTAASNATLKLRSDGRANEDLPEKKALGSLAGDAAAVWAQPHARQPGSYMNSPYAHNAAPISQRALYFDGDAATSGAPWEHGAVRADGGGSSVYAAASVRLADPDVVLSAHVARSRHVEAAGPEQRVEECALLWSQHHASPIVDMLHQYLQQQQHEVMCV